MTRVLFICIGNSCRSPIAEAFANYYGKSWITACSAGSRAAGFIMQNTIECMKERGIDISRQSSKGLSSIDLARMDYAIILEASLRDSIVLPSRRTQKLHWFVPDPVGQSIDVYRKVRDEIEVKVLDFIETIRKEN